ncbi:CHAT domain-containing protein [Streptomyces sp. ok210]|uniref:CHAT domain-containing tetratricopeptide repeat protein n=1 Tax=Streptomyces sp. ok210 TaxID=1761905 RepID=UPI0008E31821|nr:CHAT domain-containing protein [Streptomyces sp. ok210]SFT29829.1 Tetratricopeptide repeat-containing protein [Streptomyces sp. ok210]
MREELLATVWDRLRKIADTGDPAPALEREALAEARKLTALLQSSTGDPGDVTAWYALGWLRFHRYTALSNRKGREDLDAAVEAFNHCFVTGVGGLPDSLLPRLADAAVPHATEMLEQAAHATGTEVASAAVDLWQRIVHATPAGHPDRPRRLSYLGVALQGRFDRTKNLADLSAAIGHLEAAVQATPPGHPAWAPFRFVLASLLQTRATQTYDLADLNQSIGLYQAGIQATPPDHHYLVMLGAALVGRFGQTGDLADLAQAISHYKAAVRAVPPDYPERPAYLANLANALRTRFERTGDLADLGQAVTLGQEAIDATPAAHPSQAKLSFFLGSALQVRFDRTGDPADLDRGIGHLEVAVRAIPPGDPDWAGSANGLGGALRARFRRMGNPADLDRGIGHFEAALRATSPGDPSRARYLNNLGNLLQVRFERTGRLADLDQAVTTAQAAVRATPPGHPDRPAALTNLGNPMRARFGRTGDLADLDQAITIAREVVHATPSDHPHLAMYLSNLGYVMRLRFDRTGDLADLDQAIITGQEAVHAVPADHPDRALYVNNLGGALRTRFGRTGNPADLDQGIGCLEAAVRAAPSDHPERAMYLSNLGEALQTRFDRTGDLADLDRAVITGQEAVHAVPADHPDRALYVNNLGGALRIRFRQSGDLADLSEAIGHLEAAVRATPPDHPDRAGHVLNLGRARYQRFGRTRDQTDLDTAVSAFSEAQGVVSAAPSIRIQAAWLVAQLLADTEVERASEAAEAAVRLLPEVTLRQLKRGDQQHALSDFAGLAGDAAALALASSRGTRRERATRALQLLEAGRAVLLSQTLDARSDLTDLRRKRPDLATRFVQLRDGLDQPTSSTDPAWDSERTDTLTARRDRTLADRHRLSRDFADTLAEIRDLDGFASFAQPPATEELLAQTGQGPVVVFNISRYRSDALLLTLDGITQLELPQLTDAALTERVVSFHQALHTTTTDRDRSRRRQAQDVMNKVLQWLWDTAAGPVLDALGHHSQPPADTDWPRVWWAPGGLLGLLPLHAAGYHTDPADGPHRRSVMDRIISSHIPTVRALRYARQQIRESAPPSETSTQGLVVAMPTTPGLPRRGRLDHVGDEADMLRRHLPRTVLLSEPDPNGHLAGGPRPDTPTKAAVLALLPECSIAHFACHGASHPTDPSQSLLLLHDHESDPLTVASLAPVHLEQAQLAYLSACRTAVIDTADLVDEAIHLTSAFQLAGFPHVVGTLWEIDDQIAVAVADAFYTYLRAPTGTIDTNRAAWALHQAVRSVRDGHDLPGRLDRTRTPFLWAAYVHAGA